MTSDYGSAGRSCQTRPWDSGSRSRGICKLDGMVTRGATRGKPRRWASWWGGAGGLGSTDGLPLPRPTVQTQQVGQTQAAYTVVVPSSPGSFSPVRGLQRHPCPSAGHQAIRVPPTQPHVPPGAANTGFPSSWWRLSRGEQKAARAGSVAGLGTNTPASQGNSWRSPSSPPALT